MSRIPFDDASLALECQVLLLAVSVPNEISEREGVFGGTIAELEVEVSWLSTGQKLAVDFVNSLSSGAPVNLRAVLGYFRHDKDAAYQIKRIIEKGLER